MTLVIDWNGGDDIVIPSSGVVMESGRIYYNLSDLEGRDFGENEEGAPVSGGTSGTAQDANKQNPSTGGSMALAVAAGLLF